MAGEICPRSPPLSDHGWKPASAGRRAAGKVVIGTVQGDVHDIGKDIVVFMLDVNGFEVHDLGIDVRPSTFVEQIEAIEAGCRGSEWFSHRSF